LNIAAAYFGVPIEVMAETTRIAPPRLIWRLRSAASGQISECQIIDRSPISFELRIVHVPQGLTISASRFTGTDAAMKCATLLAAALRADGCTDVGAGAERRS